MATGDNIQIDFSTASKDSFRLRVTGITHDLQLENFIIDAATGRWSASCINGFPALTHENGTVANPGQIQLITATAPNQVKDVLGNLLPGGVAVASRAIHFAEPTIIGDLTATYISGLGDMATPLVDNTELAGSQSPIVIEIVSTER